MAAVPAITVPLLRPTLLFGAVITGIGYLQLFEEPFVMTQGGPLASTCRSRTTSTTSSASATTATRPRWATCCSSPSWCCRVLQFRLLGDGDATLEPRADPPGTASRARGDAPARAPRHRRLAPACRSSTWLYVVLGRARGRHVGPFVWMVAVVGQARGRDPAVPPTWWPQTLTLDNYSELFARLDFPRYFLNSVVVAWW